MQRHQLLKRHEKVSVDFDTFSCVLQFFFYQVVLGSLLVLFVCTSPHKYFEAVMCSVEIKKILLIFLEYLSSI